MPQILTSLPTPEIIPSEVINPEFVFPPTDIESEVIDSEVINPEFVFPPIDIESDEPPLESSLHLHQIFLLISCLELLWQGRDDYFAAGNLTVYYKLDQNKSPESRGPDFFVVLDTEKKDRRSWVVYNEEGVYPHVIVEILSNSTAGVDRTTKKAIYENIFRTPDYFWFHPYTLEFQGFSLVKGKYESLIPNDRGLLWSQQLGLFLGVHDQKLRYFTSSGELVPTPEEAMLEAIAQTQAETERAKLAMEQAKLATEQAELATERADMATERAELATEQAELEAQRAKEAIAQAEKLAAKLRELNIDPDQI